ncbi:MAG: proprotein convertase P-domain-containing protein [Saprospiraceae bacterium]|nr:proprotein convertase P-domain-containing protein [Saprospiraceae bacterium]
MPDNFQGNFLIQVQNAANPTLGQNGQGVCGVILNFDHEYIGDLFITLTSPAGQTVTLIGPVGLFGETDGTFWNITFVPCGDTPDPDPGFTATWSNNQNWGLLGNYSGSYYPMSGCLEGFNTGPVNGQWTLSVTDGQVNDMGNFYDYQIIFCDPADILCFSCEANAGNLLQPDVTACEGSPALSLNLIPSYTVQQPAPPASEYSYPYLVASGGAIIGYEPTADLSAYPAGNYTLCGISYLTADEVDLPPPDGSMTVTQLAAQLNSSAPPFCGKITANCVNVTIKPLPADIEDFETICSPECVEYYGNVFCTAGDHVVNLLDDGCPYTATLHLTVLQRVYETINETICAGACSATPGFEQECIAGQYSSVLTGENGCDSVVTLNLNVLQVQAAIQQAPPLSCAQSSLLLQGTGSTPPGTGITYAWTATNGGKLSGPTNGINATASSAGTYILQVCRSSAGGSCCDTAAVQVQASQDPPPPPGVILGPTSICAEQLISFRVDSLPSVSTYHWTLPAGLTLVSGQGNALIWVSGQVDSTTTICVQAENDCGMSQATCLAVMPAKLPQALAPEGNTLVCPGDTLVFTTLSTDSTLAFVWNFPAHVLVLKGEHNDTIQVLWAAELDGQVCVAAINNCDTGALACTGVKVMPLPAAPLVLGPVKSCPGAVATYQLGSVPGATTYSWSVTGGEILGKSDSSALQVQWSPDVDTGKVCVTVGTSCRSSAPGCLSVIIQPLPLANAGKDTALCGQEYQLAAAGSTPSGAGLWKVLEGPGLASIQDSSVANTMVTVSLPGKYLFEWTVEQAGCIEKDSVWIDFFPVLTTGPVAITCDGANENYTASFSVSGGAPP